MAVNLSPIWGAGAQLLDNSGNVLSGGKIYTYAAGTTTPATTYTSSSGGTANSNPIILNSAGRVPYEIWLTDGISYKFVLKDSNDTLIATYDNLVGINSNFVNFTNQQEIQTATAGQTVFTLVDVNYSPGTNSLTVFVDGVNQYGPGAQYAYVETDSTTVTFVNGLHVGASVKFTTSQLNSSSGVDAAQVSYVPPFTDSVATNVENKLAQYVSVKDFGAVGDGVTDDSAAIQNAIDSGYAIYFPNGSYLVTSELSIADGMKLYGNKDATIVSTIATVPASYNQIFVAGSAVSNISVTGLKFQTTEEAFSVFGFDDLVTNLSLVDNECEGCGLVSTTAGAENVTISNNYIHSPASEGTANDYARAIQISCAFTGNGTKNVNITDNTILGSWTHGIEVFGGDVMASLEPTDDKNVNSVTVSGNIVKATAGNTTSAGAIWFSQCADVTVTNNVCEAYWDVGIDFEACRNAVASGNSLKNNNKNLAMYGNSITVLFADNTCYNDVAGLSMFYAKPANNNAVDYQVDARNTDITLDGNKFYNAATPTGFERLEMGSGGVVSVINNTLTNCTIKAAYMSLTEIIIKNNTITHNDFGVGMVPIQVQQSYATGDATTNTLEAVIADNRIEVSNPPAGTAYSILYQIADTVGASVDYDYKTNIYNNVIRNSSSKYSIYAASVASTVTGTKYADISVFNNTCWGNLTLVTTGAHTERDYVYDNLNIAGQPFVWTKSTSGAFDSWSGNIALDTSGGALGGDFPNGEYNGQIRYLTMTAHTGTATVRILNFRSGTNVDALFTAVGQYAVLQWNVNAWDKISATCGGI